MSLDWRREAVLIHQVADQIGDARRPARPLHFLVRGKFSRSWTRSGSMIAKQPRQQADQRAGGL